MRLVRKVADRSTVLVEVVFFPLTVTFLVTAVGFHVLALPAGRTCRMTTCAVYIDRKPVLRAEWTQLECIDHHEPDVHATGVASRHSAELIELSGQ